MAGFEKQTYTQVPNSLFEVMGEMDECELKVVLYVCRHTFGYHRESFKISTRKIADAIGMSVASVAKGAEAAEVRGLLERINEGQNTTEWRAIVALGDSNSDTPSAKVIQKLNQGDSKIESQVGLNKVKEINRESTKNIISALQNNGIHSAYGVAERITDWTNEHDDAWIIKAIEKGRGKNLNYIDRILLDWKANGYPKSRAEQIAGAKRTTQPAANERVPAGV